MSPTPATAELEPTDLSCPGCNVILINIGLLRADRVGLISGSHGVTPHIDAFFRDGIVFEQAMAPSGATYLSATAIATATEAMLNPHEVLLEDAFSIDPDISEHQARKWMEGGGRWLVLAMLQREGPLFIDRLPTLAQVFHGAGYRTVAVNDWIHTGRHVLLDRGYGDYTELTDDEHRGRRDLTTTVPIGLQVDLVIDKLGVPDAAPLLLSLHPNTLHFPFPHPDDPRVMVYRGDAAELFARAYDSRVAEVDEALGKLFARLEEGRWMQRSMVVLYANHGVNLGENGALGVGVSYQGTVHAPLLVRHPKVTAQRRVATPVSLVDLGPTLWEMAAITPVPKTLAHSMVPAASARGAYVREALFGKDLQQQFVRRREWKLILTAEGSKELYRLSEDPHETEDLSAQFPGVVDELELLLGRERVRQLGFAAQLGG